MNSLLSASFPERRVGLPQFDRFSPLEVQEAIELLIGRVERVTDTVGSADGADAATRYAQIAEPLEQAQDDLRGAYGTVEHLHRVCDSEAMRAVYGPAQERVTQHYTALMQNRRLYEAFQSIADAPGFSALALPKRRAVERFLRDFRLGGIALADTPRARFAQIAIERAKLSTAFEEAVLDATESWKKHVAQADNLRGVPADALARFAKRAEAQGLAGYLVGLDYPSYSAVMSYAEDRNLRAELYRAYATRASDQGPDAGRFDNSARIEQLLALKAEAAELLGFASAADESLATKMAQSPTQVLDFLHELIAKARPAAAAELERLRQFARVSHGIENLEPWDLAFFSEKYKAAHLGFDDESIRPYFPYPHVLSGLFAIVERLFDVKIRPGESSVWHPDVGFYHLCAGEMVIASFYVDPYARAKKRSGAWMDVCRSQRRVGELVRRPVAYLNCNFAPPSEQQPSLLTHSDVVTLFHEFGHGLHHMLSTVDVPAVGGIEGVEWDAVELPSQFLENFCWQDAALDLLSAHIDTGAKIPDVLKRQLRAGKHFHSGLFLVRQLEFALFDFTLHLQTPAPTITECLAIAEQARAQTAVLPAPSWHRYTHSFSHIFSGGYAAGYYSYLWAQVLSSDAFAAFDAALPFDPACGKRFRQEILAVGATRDAAESFRAFRGRDPEIAALLESYGLAS